MKGVLVHGGLLVVMLAFGYQTWTRDKSVHVSTGDVSVWDMSAADLESVTYDQTKPDPATPTKNTERTVHIEKKTDAAGAYWWGTETRTEQKAKPQNADAGSNAPPPDTVASTTSSEFPIGDSFRITGQTQPMTIDEWVKDLSSMHAVRSLGTLSDDKKKEYELNDSDTTISVASKSGKHTFVLGAKVSGSSERYALDVDSGTAYIIAGAMVEPIETGESALKPSSIHGFDATSLDSVEIGSGGKMKKVARITTTDDKGTQTKTWAEAGTQKADQTLANFVDSLDRLIPDKFDTALKPGDMTPLLTAKYADASGKQIGALALYAIQQPGDLPADGSADPTSPPPPVTQYYIFTEATRVAAHVPKAAAERVTQSVGLVFEPPAQSGSGSGGGGGGGPGGAAGSGAAPGSGAGAGSASPAPATP
jgi:hypothetical protein